MKDSIFSLFNGKNFTNYFLKFYVTYFKLFYAKKNLLYKIIRKHWFFRKKTVQKGHNYSNYQNNSQYSQYNKYCSVIACVIVYVHCLCTVLQAV